jgi:hypothetical protein
MLIVYWHNQSASLCGSFGSLYLACKICSHEHICMSSFGPRPPQFDLYYAAIDKQTGRTVAVGMSAPGVLADASEITGLPKDRFEIRKIDRDEYERI